MIKKSKLFGLAAIVVAIVVIAIVGVGVASCSGPEGPIGPEGPQGPAGSSGTGADGADGSDGQDGSDGRPATPVVVYTITYDSNGGSAVDSEELIKGGKATKPEHPTRPFTAEQIMDGGPGLYRVGAGSGWIFNRWILDGEPYDFDKAVTADITLTATWSPPGKIDTGSGGINAVPADSDFFDKALTFVIGNPASYYLVIDDDYIAQTKKTATVTGITLTIVGLEIERTITSNATDGTLFDINNGAQLYLEDNITLKGKVGNSTQPLINITNGTLYLQTASSKITGHTTGGNNGTIYVTGTTSRFVMDDGEISGNENTNSPSIVKIDKGGRFTMNDGIITENKTVAGGAAVNLFYTAGISDQGYFTMNGGTITGNTNPHSTGGVYIGRDCVFTMTGGIITGNTAPIGDVFISYNLYLRTNFILSGNAAIGTLGTVSASYTGTPPSKYTAPIRISNWTGAVQVLNLYYENSAFANVATMFVSKPLIAPEDGSNYTLISADIDKFKQFFFLNSNFIQQDISTQGKGIVKSGDRIGYMTP
jgi:hypothetical protein